MAVYDDVEMWIRSENGHQDSVDDQIYAFNWFLNRKITVIHERRERTSTVEDALEERCDYQVRRVLDNLEEIEVLVQFDPPGSGRYIRSHRTEENFFNIRAREFVPLFKEELSRLLEDLRTQEAQHVPQVADGGVEDEDPGEEKDDDTLDTLRTVIADALEVSQQDVEEALTQPTDVIDQMNRYDAAVKAIKASDGVSRRLEYDEMGWRNSALRWSLSERAARIGLNESLPT